MVYVTVAGRKPILLHGPKMTAGKIARTYS
jgi:hypothetical protein